MTISKYKNHSISNHCRILCVMSNVTLLDVSVNKVVSAECVRRKRRKRSGERRLLEKEERLKETYKQ